MNRLPDDVLAAFEQGDFVAKLSQGQFNGVWINYSLEATENKALKGTGGITGLTPRGPALARWFLAGPMTAQYSSQFLEGICLASQKRKNKRQHHEAGDAAQKRWTQTSRRLWTCLMGHTLIHSSCLQIRQVIW